MARRYHLDPKKYRLQKLHRSLAKRKLIPSRIILKQNLDKYFGVLDKAGIKDLDALLTALKTKPKIEAFAKQTKIPVAYLTVLNREAKSYLPNPIGLNRFDGIDSKLLTALAKAGIKNTKQLFDRTATAAEVKNLAKEVAGSTKDLEELAGLSDLARLYGVGPVFAKMLVGLGINTAKAFVSSTPTKIVKLYEQQTQKKADFSTDDIAFSIEIAREYSS